MKMSSEAVNIVLNLSPDGSIFSFSVEESVSVEGLTEVKSESNSPDVCPTCTCRISVYIRRFSPEIKTEVFLGKEEFSENIYVANYDGIETRTIDNASFDEDEKPIIELFVGKSDVTNPNSPTKPKKKFHREGTSKQKRLEATKKKPYIYKYECEQCSKVFRMVHRYRQHLSKHGPVKCHKCQVELKDEESYTKHMETHAKTWTHRCEICNQCLLSEETLAAHIRWVHEKNHSCSFCGKVFARWRHLNEHENTHKNITPYQCDLCGASFSRVNSLHGHLKAVHQKIEYICDFCEKGYKTKFTLRNHILGHHVEPKEVFECEHCKKCFTSVHSYKSHLESHAGRTHRTVMAALRCLHCNKVFQNEHLLMQHQRVFDIVGGPTELVPDAVKCLEHCNRCFTNEEELQMHLKKVLKTAKKKPIRKCEQCPNVFQTLKTFRMHLFTHGPVECHKCKRQFKDKTSYKKHMETHVKSRTQICEICNKRLDTEAILPYHIRWYHTMDRACSFCGKTLANYKALHDHENMHMNKSPNVCHVCGVAYTREDTLLKHLESHQGVEYICNFCGKSYKDKKYLRHHILGYHIESEDVFQCEHCPKCFTNIRLYKIHVQRHGASFPCAECGKKFTSKADVMCHVNSMHTELSNRPKFECETCGKILLNKKSMKIHKNTHKDVTEFKCRYCPYNAIALHTLKRHELIHTGERPFSCQTCGKSFRHSDTLKTHIRLHTGEKPYECPLEECKKRFSDRGCFRGHLLNHEKQLNIKLVTKKNYLNDL